MRSSWFENGVLLVLLLCLLVSLGCATPRSSRPDYSSYVWPPPPDKARIRLVDILTGRADVEGGSRVKDVLIGASPQTRFDRLRKPHAVQFDAEGGLLVTDPAMPALLRFDLENGRMDVYGTKGSLALRVPLGIGLGPDGTIYVADAGIRRVLAFDKEGQLKTAYGAEGDLTNPTDAAVSPDGKLLYVADSKEHRIVVFDIETKDKIDEFGKKGEGEGEFSWPTSLVFDKKGDLFIVDQINSRIQVFGPDGAFLDSVGHRGVSFGGFVRPKDIALDDRGYIFVSDAAFSNVQIFDESGKLLTFVGKGGRAPGQFQIATGVSVSGKRFAVVDELGSRIQLFEFVDGGGE